MLEWEIKGGHFKILSTTHIKYDPKCMGCKILSCHNYIICGLEPFLRYRTPMR